VPIRPNRPPRADKLAITESRAEGIICDVRETIVDAPPERVFELIGNVGGKNGWFYANFLWSLRGWIDRLIGGVGMKRGTAHF
jgi:uncharacterized protein DUF2867